MSKLTINSTTEEINPNTKELDQLSSLDLVKTFISEDAEIIVAIEKAKEDIAKAIDTVYEGLNSGGRLLYFGSGTSGRLGILDAVECPPTFSTHPEMVQGIIAGGEAAIRKAVEAAEDNEEAGYEEVKKLAEEKPKSSFPKGKDIIVGITASGRTPYVIGALKAAKELGLPNIAISNTAKAETFEVAENKIFLETGAEVLSGSTRLKAGTSQKMVLNILTTSAMVKLGKTYGNLMVDLRATNEKLVVRATRLVSIITGSDEKKAKEALEACEYRVKNAVLYIRKGLEFPKTVELLEKNNGFLAKSLED